jgi:hypothetical protein
VGNAKDRVGDRQGALCAGFTLVYIYIVVLFKKIKPQFQFGSY